MINPSFLRTFVHLAQSRHFTRTAEALHMTQPGVSQHIHKLEAQLGQPLLSRHGKSFELTPAGEQLYHFGLQQAEAEATLMENLAADGQHAGECRLACSGSIAMQLYPKLLQLQQRYPALRISIEAAPNRTIIERIRSNRSDIGLVSQPLNESKLIQRPLGQDPLCLALPTDSSGDFDWKKDRKSDEKSDRKNSGESNWETLLQLGLYQPPRWPPLRRAAVRSQLPRPVPQHGGDPPNPVISISSARSCYRSRSGWALPLSHAHRSTPSRTPSESESPSCQQRLMRRSTIWPKNTAHWRRAISW